VSFADVLPDDELVALLCRAHVAVAPAVFEALGLATLEALACGTPVAGARSGATEALLKGACGATFEPFDPDACAAAIVGLLQLPSDESAVAARRVAVAPYDLTTVASQIEQRYSALLSAG
jgi:glycosyltransferase involved in cell wall biosynthesis